MELLQALPVWAVAIGVFWLRIVDVSLGTLRTISVVQGRVLLAVAIGFVEVLIWVTVVSNVIVRVREDPVLLVTYAAGFAAGNACGIGLERWIGMGTCVIRMIASRDGSGIAKALRTRGYDLTTFDGRGPESARTLLFTSCRRRELPAVIQVAAELDPNMFYTVERFSQTGQLGPLPHPTGWRAVFKKK